MTNAESHVHLVKLRRKILLFFLILLVAYLPGRIEGYLMPQCRRVGLTTNGPIDFHSRGSAAKNRRRSQTNSQQSDENYSSTSKILRDDIGKRAEGKRAEGQRLETSSSIAASVGRRDLIINVVALGLLGASGLASYSLFQTSAYTPPDFRRLPRTQFIAALGDPQASQGTDAKSWGLWVEDPGPRGVWLKDYTKDIVQMDNHAPAGWTFDPSNWWLEEHGLIMEAPKFPLKEGRYLVTGGRLVTTGLTIDSEGRWKLDEGTLSDVTHLPCRSARYQPLLSPGGSGTLGSPLEANPRDFPVSPGAVMPEVKGCSKQDYAVLFVVGKAGEA
jgi:hypothetical protein